MKRRRASSVDAESGRSAPVEASIAIVSQLLDSSSISPSRSTTPKRRQLDDNLPHKSLNIPLSTLYRNYVKPAKPYWFDDGDYILIVSDHFFKVPFRMLSCSDIFADMFALAQPQATELLDGCPVIQLTDRPQDWMVSLQWMDNPLTFWEKDMIPYDTLAGALRISAKYEIEQFRQEAVTQIYKIWPRDLSKISECERAFSTHRADAITLARQCDLPEIIPAIFYALATDQRNNDTSASSGLSAMDQQRLLVGRQRLEQFHQETLEMARHLGACTTCMTNIVARWTTELNGARQHSSLMSLLTSVGHFGGEFWKGVCGGCMAHHLAFTSWRLSCLVDSISTFFNLR